MTEMLWQPSSERVANANLTRFAAMVRERHGVDAGDYAALHRWSIEDRAAFWTAIWEYAAVIGDQGDGAGARGRPPDAGSDMVSRGAAQLRREPCSAAGTMRPASCSAARIAFGAR